MYKRYGRSNRKTAIAVTIALLLIAAGCVLIILAFGAKWEVDRAQMQLRQTYERQQQTLASNEPDSEQTPAMLPDVLPGDTDAQQAAADTAGSVELEPVCVLTIPSIDLSVVVAEGIDYAVLRYAVGHFPTTAQAGEAGNFCLAGHRSYAYGAFFNRLDQLRAGDALIVERNGETFTYSVSEILVVEPDDTWVLNPTEDAQITLVTCTPIRVGTQRLIVKGVLQQ